MNPTLTAVQAAEPSVEPLSLEEVRKHLELGDNEAHDTYLASLIEAARKTFEFDTGLVTVTRSFVECLDAWPAEDYITLMRRPVSAITSIQYVDTSGVTQTFASASYALDSRRVLPIIRLKYGYSWPNLRGDPNSVTITYVAGYATADAVPENLRVPMLVWIASRFYAREGGDLFGTFAVPKQEAVYSSLIKALIRANYP
jgi:uncharacterized phiE125 gp8 family phage protein